jgi:hypoxanthine phosphoribosyltransferase
MGINMSKLPILKLDYKVCNTLLKIIIDNMVRDGTAEHVAVIIAPARGGLIPGTVLSHNLGIPLVPISFSTRDHVTAVAAITDGLIERVNKFVDNEHKIVLIVDDIIDSGVSMKELVVLLNEKAPNLKIKTASLVTKKSQTKVNVDYTGLMLEGEAENQWISYAWEEKI